MGRALASPYPPAAAATACLLHSRRVMQEWMLEVERGLHWVVKSPGAAALAAAMAGFCFLKKLIAGLALLSAFTACATSGNRGPGRPAVALRRGSAWVTYSFALPSIVGPTADLRLKDGVFRGLVDGRAVEVKVSQGEATGFAPRGPANLKIAEHDGQVDVDGMWNGGPAHLAFAPSFLRGSLVVVRGRTGAQERSCGYQLDRVEPPGALVGSSACSGMPQETRLEVDPAVRQLLSPAELAVFLVMVLATPPGP
jgi:hypothetical protein